jgi:hypothetical protein
MNSLLVKRTHSFLDGEVPPPQRPWLPLLLSAVLHLLLISGIVVITRREVQDNRVAPSAQAEPERRIDLATLPPYQPPSRRAAEPPKPQPPSRRAAASPQPDRMPPTQLQRGEHQAQEVTVATETQPE